MTDLTQQLTDLAGLLSIAGAPGFVQPGQSIVATLVPPLSPLSYTEVVEHPINLELILKQVVFTDTNFNAAGWVEDAEITKILPMFNLASSPLPTQDTSGVPGLVGRLKGNFPVAIPTEAVPEMSVEWIVTDDAGNPLVEGSDFLAPNGLANPSLDIVFLPAFERFDGAVPGTTGRKITARVTLTAGGSSVPRDVGPVRVLIPVIPFPKVLALTLDSEFRGAALIMVPSGSGVNSIDHLRTLLDTVRNAIAPVTSVARFAEMLTGINTLGGILNASNIQFRRANQINNLNDITLIQRAWYENDTEAEDELSAFVYISPPPPPRNVTDNVVEICNARNLGSGEGRFTVATGTSFVALCRSLHTASPTVTPADAAVSVTNTPPGGWFNPSDFGDALSSIRFL